MITTVWWVICQLRKPLSWILWVIFKIFLKTPVELKWFKKKSLSLVDFNKDLAKTAYNWDPGMGIFDYTLYDLDYFFDSSNDGKWAYGRDCDDFSYAWFCYLSASGLCSDVYMILGTNGLDIRRAHAWTVARSKHDGRFSLFNYQMLPSDFSSLADACEEFSRKSLVVGGTYDKLIWVVYRHHKG